MGWRLLNDEEILHVHNGKYSRDNKIKVSSMGCAI